MPRQQSRGAPSAPPPLPSPNSSQPPPIIVLPPGESHAARNAPTAAQYGDASTLVSQNQLHQGVHINQPNIIYSDKKYNTNLYSEEDTYI